MPNVTFSVAADVHKEMRAHPEIKWSEVARRAIVRELERIHTYDKLLAGSKLKESDAVELGRVIRRAAAKRHE